MAFTPLFESFKDQVEPVLHILGLSLQTPYVARAHDETAGLHRLIEDYLDLIEPDKLQSIFVFVFYHIKTQLLPGRSQLVQLLLEIELLSRCD